ncbi:MAG: hypothetical protein IPL46_31425 [Saprospiraceae bacterium]|nr:hypothetical protein [Saprospiraceae bacterium]
MVIVILGANVTTSAAQSISRWQVPVTDLQSHVLVNPFGGGLNSPQFSSIHLNGDDLSDIYVFDRSGGKSLAFIADTSITSGYRHAPDYENIFPGLHDWVLLRDYNQDSLPDIFTFSSTGVPGIDVYRAERINGQISFVKEVFNNPVKVLGYPTSSGTVTNIYVASTDIPAIDDMDGDGDLDILTFQSDGTKLYYYRNLARENNCRLIRLILSSKTNVGAG